MLNNLILIENGKYKQFSSEIELVEYLFGDQYYSLSQKEKQDLMELNALSRIHGTNLKISKSKPEKEENIANKFVIYNEKTFVLSLLRTNQVTLLEKRDSNIYTKNMDKADIQDNYIIVNTFAEKLLKSAIGGF